MTNTRSLSIGYLLQTTGLDLSRPSGPQVHVVRIVRGLQERGHQVRLVQLADRGIRWSDNLEDWHSVPYPSRWRPLMRAVERPIRLAQTLVPRLPYLNYFDSLRFADAARAVLDDVDVLYERYNFMSYGGVLLSRMLSVPLLLEVNGHPFDETRIQGRAFSWSQRMVSIGITRWTLQHATVVLPSGYGWKRRLVETGLLSHDRVHVVWPGVDYDLFAADQDTAALRDRWSLHGARVIVFTGSFDPWQGLSTLIHAFARVSQDCHDVVLVLAGDGFMRDEIERLTMELGCSAHVLFLGRIPQEEVADLLAIADIGVLCIENHAEFVRMKLFDYMASGLATVVTAPQRRHELVVDDETGLVVEPGDVDALTQALLRLLGDGDLRRRLGNRARKEASGHTWAHRVAEIERVALSTMRA